MSNINRIYLTFFSIKEYHFRSTFFEMFNFQTLLFSKTTLTTFTHLKALVVGFGPKRKA